MISSGEMSHHLGDEQNKASSHHVLGELTSSGHKAQGGTPVTKIQSVAHIVNQQTAPQQYGLDYAHSAPRAGNGVTKRQSIAQLIGKKCLVWCTMNNVKSQALWDTGAQVSILSEE